MTSFDELVFFPAPVSQGSAPFINQQICGGCPVVGLNPVGTPFSVGAIQPGGSFNGIQWIRVYSNPGGVTGISVQLNGSNAVQSYGRDSNDWPGSHWISEYTFDPGEYIAYTMLSLNDAGYLGRIELVTNLNQRGTKAAFAAGNPDFNRKYTLVRPPVNGSSKPAQGTLMGIAGTTDTQHITTLGLAFLPPIQTMVLQDPVLDLTRAQISEVPVVIQHVQPMSVGDAHAYTISAPNNSHTETSSFTYGTSLSQGFKYTVEMTAGSKLLGIEVKQGLEFSVDLTQTWEWDKGVEDSVSVAFSDTINVEPGQTIESSITVSKGTVTVPHTCTAIATFEDGTQATYSDFHGIFYGVRYYDVTCNVTIKSGDKSRTESLKGQVQPSVSS